MVLDMQHDKLLQDQVALVTGGTAGIGKSICLKFAQHGATVIVIGTNPERGNQVISEIAQLTGNNDKAYFYAADVSNKQQVEEVIKECLAKHHRIDIVVNNAGIVRDNLLMRMSEEEWDQVLDTNLKSCFNVCQAVVRPMIKARKGKIINVTSIIGLIGNAGQSNYAASKAGIIGFSKSLAKELASRNICINCIAPGFIDTAMTKELPENVRTDILSKVPMSRMGSPEEIAQCALFLASDWSSYMTGQVLVVDGGMVI